MKQYYRGQNPDADKCDESWEKCDGIAKDQFAGHKRQPPIQQSEKV